MFMRAVRSHAKYGIALVGAPTALSYAHSEPRVYASGYVCFFLQTRCWYQQRGGGNT